MEVYIQAVKQRFIPWTLARARAIAASVTKEGWITVFAFLAAISATTYAYLHGYVIAYGDAESHLNIAKRVVDGLTPGLAQLGGIWLPLPHILLAPFVYFDFLWRSGLAGSIVSGLAFIVSALYISKLTRLLTGSENAGFFAALIFIVNPNVLYMQSTPMTELVLIAFFVLSTYYFILYLRDPRRFVYLISAAFFGFCASLSRYDGWALVLVEAGILLLYYFPWRVRATQIMKRIRLRGDEKTVTQVEEKKELVFEKKRWNLLEGRFIVFSTLAFLGILLWLVWGFLILGDALYFTHSEFSAKSQQNSWYERGELPSYQNIGSSLLYYSVTALRNIGLPITVLAALGLLLFLFDRSVQNRAYALLVLLVPFLFNVATLYLGQSVIFIPELTPETFSWNLFNVRYGLMMVPFAAIFAGYLFYRLTSLKYRAQFAAVLAAVVVLQLGLYATSRAQVITLDDGLTGLSSNVARIKDAELWFAANYDHGIVLMDDFSRAISIVRSGVDMEDTIYVGNKPYWEESLKEPEKYARWIIMQQNDPIWNQIGQDPVTNARLFAHFNKVYTSDEILIFRKIDDGTTATQ